MKENLLIFIDFAKKLYRSRYMLRMMTLRDLKASYVGSFFGFAWAVLSPLLQVVIYGVVFGVFFKSRPDPVYGTDSYLLFLLCGLVAWQFFAQTVTLSANSVLSNKALVKKAVGFPSEILPVVTVISNIISHLISLGLLFTVILFSSAHLTPFVFLVFVYLFFIVLFAVGVGWVVSSVNVFLRDIQQIVGLVVMGWFFLTPVFYSPGIVPKRFAIFMKLNPLYHFVEGYRLALLSGRMLPWGDFTYFAAISILSFGAGGVFFRKLKPWFAEVL